MSNQHESNGPARQDRAIQEVRSNPAAYFNSTTQQGSRGSAPSSTSQPRPGR